MAATAVYCEISFLDETAAFHKLTSGNTEQDDRTHYKAGATIEQFPMMGNNQDQSASGFQDADLKQTAQFFFPQFDPILNSSGVSPSISMTQTSPEKGNEKLKKKKLDKELTDLQSKEQFIQKITSNSKKTVKKMEEICGVTKQEEHKRCIIKSRSQPRLDKQSTIAGAKSLFPLDINNPIQEKPFSYLLPQTSAPSHSVTSQSSQAPTMNTNLTYKNRFSNNRPSLQSLSVLKDPSFYKQPTQQQYQHQNFSKVSKDESKSTRLNNFINSLANNNLTEASSLKTNLALAAAQSSKSQQIKGVLEKQKIPTRIYKDGELDNYGKLSNLRLLNEDIQSSGINNQIYKQNEIPSSSQQQQTQNQKIMTPYRPLVMLSPNGTMKQNQLHISSNTIQDKHSLSLPLGSRKSSNSYIDQIEQVQKNLLDDHLLESLRKQQQLLQQIRQQQIKHFEGLHAPINSPLGAQYAGQQQQQQQQQQGSQFQLKQFQQQQIFDSNSKTHLRTIQLTQTNQTEYTLADSTDRNEQQYTVESMVPLEMQRRSSKSNLGCYNSSDMNQKIKSRHMNTFHGENIQQHSVATFAGAGRKSFQIAENQLIQDSDSMKPTLRKQFYSFHSNPLGQIQSVKGSSANMNTINTPQQEELANDLERARKQIRQSISKSNSYKVSQQFPQFYSGQQGLPLVGQRNTLGQYISQNVNKDMIRSKQTSNTWIMDVKQAQQQYDDRVDSSREARTADTAQSTKLKTFLQRKPQENILNKIFSNQPEQLE